MSRLMAVSLTEKQVRDHTKTVTRRMGWLMLKAGDRLTLCPKAMGFRKGESPERIVDVEVVSVRRERLDLITQDEVIAEGFPGRSPDWFVAFFCGSHKGCRPDSGVTRIEWRYLCRHCDKPIERCHVAGGAPTHGHPMCKGWRHAGYESRPVIGHCCGGRSINPAAEPGEDAGDGQ